MSVSSSILFPKRWYFEVAHLEGDSVTRQSPKEWDQCPYKKRLEKSPWLLPSREDIQKGSSL